MSGVILLGVVLGWIALSATIGYFIARRVPVGNARIAARMILTPLVFLIPVADEIIAWPRMSALCDKVSAYEYDEKTARGRTVRPTLSSGGYEQLVLFPDIKVVIERFDQLDAVTGERVVSWYQITTSGGKAGFPSASGSRHPWILPEKCSVRVGAEGHLQFLQRLNISIAKK